MRRFTLMLLILIGSLASVGRAATELKDQPLMSEVVQGNNQFAVDLYGRLREQPGNLFFSPYSLSTALAMTYAGARGETAEQMADTLHFTVPQEQLPTAFAALARQINEQPESQPYQLSVANALWGQEGYHFLPEFLKVLETQYAAGLRQVDFRSSEQARRRINSWVAKQTHDKIQDLIQPPYPARDTTLILTNAIYFKGSWVSPFSEKNTRDDDFQVTADKVIPVPMMHRSGRYRYFEGDDLQALELPYRGHDLSMVVLLPRENDGLARLEGPLSEETLSGWLSRLSSRQVEVALPKFKLEESFQLQDQLAALGMPAAFGSRADFSGMDGQRDLYLSAVIHKAFVDVNEEGTEAAAATGVVVGRMSILPADPPVTFRADHPFLFLIRDNRSGSILFLGRVTNPQG